MEQISDYVSTKQGCLFRDTLSSGEGNSVKQTEPNLDVLFYKLNMSQWIY